MGKERERERERVPGREWGGIFAQVCLWARALHLRILV